jgi:hypothetical protein
MNGVTTEKHRERGRFIVLQEEPFFRHPFIDWGMGISWYGSTLCPDLTWMTVPLEFISSTSGSYGRCTQ